MNITKLTNKQKIEKGIKSYYEVVIYNICYENYEDVIGRYDNIAEAKVESRKFAEQNLNEDEDRQVEIHIFYYNGLSFEWDKEAIIKIK